MPITRINQFEAKPGAEEQLHAFMQSVVSVILGCPGCISCKLLRSIESPGQLAVIEVWDSIESHRKAAAAIPRETLAQAGALFAKPPVGAYYQE